MKIKTLALCLLALFAVSAQADTTRKNQAVVDASVIFDLRTSMMMSESKVLFVACTGYKNNENRARCTYRPLKGIPTDDIAPFGSLHQSTAAHFYELAKLNNVPISEGPNGFYEFEFYSVRIVNELAGKIAFEGFVQGDN